MTKWNQWAATNSTLLASIGWVIGGDLAWMYVASYNCPDQSVFTSGDLLTSYQGTLGLLGFATAGVVTGYALKLAIPSMSWKHVGWIGIGWVVGLVIGLNLGLAIGRAAGDIFADRPELFLLPNPKAFTRLGASQNICGVISIPIGLGFSFIIGGAVIGDTLRTLSTLTISQKQIAWMTVGWVVSLAIGMVYTLFLLFPTIVLIARISMDTTWTISFAFFLVISGYAVRLKWPTFSWRHTVFLAIKWTIAITLGVLIGLSTYLAINFAYNGIPANGFGWPYPTAMVVSLVQYAGYGVIGIEWALGSAIVGAIGLSVTLRCIRRC